MFHLGFMVTYEPLHPAGYVLVRSSLVDTPAEVAALLAELGADPDLQRGAGVLIDVCASQRAWTSAQVDAVVPAFRALAGAGVSSIAIVADVDVAYGMSRMLSIRLDSVGLDAMVFRTVPEAEAWLSGAGSDQRLKAAS